MTIMPMNRLALHLGGGRSDEGGKIPPCCWCVGGRLPALPLRAGQRESDKSSVREIFILVIHFASLCLVLVF